MSDLLKQAAEPQIHSIPPHEKHPHRYSPCPICNGVKSKVSEMCRRCRTASRRPRVTSEVVFVEGEPCRLIPLTQGQHTVISLHRYNELSQYNWSATPDKNGGWYAMRGTGTRMIGMHQQIVGEERIWVDHKNGNKLDNRDSNLRSCTPAQNHANKGITRSNKSGYKGVCRDKHKNKWMASITVRYVPKFLGYFTDKIDAARAYDRAAIANFGEFAHTNFPISDYQ